MTREVPVAAPLGVFTPTDARRAGWTRSALAHAVRTGLLEHIGPGAWAPALDPGDPATEDVRRARRSVRAAMGARGAVVSHTCAATVLGLPSWAPRPRPCVTVVGRQRIALAGVHTHRGPETTVVRRGQVFATPVARTVVDIAREHGVEAALVTADAALHLGCLSLAELRTAAGVIGPGGVRAREAAALADGAAESPLESRSRWHLHRHRLTPSRSQAWLFSEHGRFLGRTDFFWDEGVVGEVDGLRKYDTAQALRREKLRQEALEATGLLVVRWGAGDLGRFDAVAARIRDRRALAARAGWPREWLLGDSHGPWSASPRLPSFPLS